MTTITPTPTFWRVNFSTRHFDFEGYGHTKAQAMDALQTALAVHAAQHDTQDGWDSGWEDANSLEFSLGGGYRDGFLIAVGDRA